MAEPLLETVALSRYFGALAAVKEVSLAFEKGAVHAIIGPNGAGKSTLLNLLSGELPPTSGRVRFKGREIGGAPPERISQLGIGRSYQRANLFDGFSCRESVFLAAQSRLRSSMRFFRPASRLASVRERADRALSLCGLAGRADEVTARLSHGEQRQLELGMVLATEPELLLLDEPLAGMGHDEAASVIALLLRLARDHTIVLVEHDMEAVFSVADAVTVLVNGEVLETGTTDQIRESRAVQEAYLGEAP